MKRIPRFALAALAAITVTAALFASTARADAQLDERLKAYKQIIWVKGPMKVALGDKADFMVPAGYRFTDATGARLWAEANQNPPDNSLGVVTPISNDLSWFVEFSYDSIGHVKDDEKSSFTDEAVTNILTQCRSATEAANQTRKARGWPALTIVGWEQKPFYDDATHHMMWAIRCSANGDPAVNYKCKLLGREGVMDALLVGAPEELSTAVPAYKSLMGQVTFRPGSRYEEFRSGDKVAEYGLVGLITGTAAVVAVKAWKPIMAAIMAGFAGIGAAFRKIKNFFTGKKSQSS
jgi:uncharacterized membrane-anchored protein